MTDDDFVRRSNDLAHETASALLVVLEERLRAAGDDLKLGACALTMAAGHVQAVAVKTALDAGMSYEAALAHVTRCFNGTLANLLAERERSQ